MLQNIVFDMGGVLLTYQPRKFCLSKTQNEEDAEKIYQALFCSPEWGLLDLDALTEQEALNRVCSRLPERLQGPCKHIFAHWHESMTPVEGMEAVVFALKERNYHLYLCSNAGLRFYQYRSHAPALSAFDGLLVSAEEKCAKPDPAIYQRLFEKFSLKPEECLFTDDLKANIDSAERCGMESILFEGAEKFRADLVRRKIL